MSRLRRIRSEGVAAWRAFLRRRTAVFFTFFFPVLVVVVFGALITTQPTGGGLFAQPPAYYVPGYLAVVVLLTPLSRVGSTVARHREGSRFEKLATTPLTRGEWLAAHAAVNVVVIGLAGALLVGLTVLLTGAALRPSALLVPFVVLGVTLFCAVGALLGSLADSQDGVIAAANAVGFPLLFLSETFVGPELLPAWFRPAVELSPLTYFARGVRAATAPELAPGVDPLVQLGVLAALTAAFFAAAALAVPWTD